MNRQLQFGRELASVYGMVGWRVDNKKTSTEGKDISIVDKVASAHHKNRVLYRARY